jgi:hypothetical protein
MINQIQRALERALQNQPGDFLLSTKQEDYLTYRISSELTNSNNISIIPTQYNRYDIVEINQTNNQISKIIEAKYHYSSDFANISKYGEKCTKNDYNKLNDIQGQLTCEKYLLQFIVHFNESHIREWNNHLNGNIFGFNEDSKYFTYIHNRALNRINPNLHFRNTNENIYNGNFSELYVNEINSFNLSLQYEGHCYFDLTDAIVRLTATEFHVPHEFHCFLWKIRN